jgi:predicted GNAT superfamily acetyltransferase
VITILVCAVVAIVLAFWVGLLVIPIIVAAASVGLLLLGLLGGSMQAVGISVMLFLTGAVLPFLLYIGQSAILDRYSHLEGTSGHERYKAIEFGMILSQIAAYVAIAFFLLWYFDYPLAQLLPPHLRYQG